MDIAIIGAGPIGCYTGYFLAKAGHKVIIYENHPQIGSPVQCTGILTADFDELDIPVDSFLVNTISRIDVISPHQELSVRQKEYLVCRIRFDNYFASLAQKAGATILCSHSFERKENNTLIIRHKEREVRITPDIVIGADGPLSPTAKAYGMYHPSRVNFFGVQATVEASFDPHTIKTYFGTDVCPGLFAWIAPESSTTARVGVATLKNSRQYFDKFMKEQNFTATAMQAGTIPVYHPRQVLQKDNCYLVGDASGYVKATTLGGLVPALKQAKILTDCIINRKDYKKEVKSLRREMWAHLQVHKIFSRFTNTDWDTLVGYVAQPKIQEVFEKYTRDNPLPLITSALLREPRFLRFTKYLFPFSR